jgi:hypothetical protein
MAELGFGRSSAKKKRLKMPAGFRKSRSGAFEPFLALHRIVVDSKDRQINSFFVNRNQIRKIGRVF